MQYVFFNVQILTIFLCLLTHNNKIFIIPDKLIYAIVTPKGQGHFADVFVLTILRTSWIIQKATQKEIKTLNLETIRGTHLVIWK